jgi:hypothetical protein
MRAKHPTISLTLYEPLWQLTGTETYFIKDTWLNRHKQKKTRKSGNDKSSSLIVSEAHSLRLALRWVFWHDFVVWCSRAKRDVHDTSSEKDNSQDNIVHAPDPDSDTRDLDTENEGGTTDDILQAESISISNNENSAHYSPEPPTALAENPPVSALLNSSSVPAEGPPTAPETAAAGLPTIETDIDHQFSLDGLATRIGRKRKAKDLPSILQVCTCGKTVQEADKSSHGGVIQCKAVRCETVWVSVDMSSRNITVLTGLTCSIICNVLGLSTA